MAYRIQTKTTLRLKSERQQRFVHNQKTVKDIEALTKIIAMKSRMFNETNKFVYLQDLDYVLNQLKELEQFLK